MNFKDGLNVVCILNKLIEISNHQAFLKELSIYYRTKVIVLITWYKERSLKVSP